MLQNSSRWVAIAIAISALMAFSGDARSDITPANQRAAAAAPPSAETDLLAVDQLRRASIASRAQIRAELAEAAAAAATETPVATPEPEPVPAPAVQAPVRTAQVAAPPAVPETCPVNQFCYPRVGIAGNIVPYTDCTGQTDVGTAIRSITCVSPTYLAAHAYTQFGRIAGWRTGDVVFAYGTRYIIEGAFTQPGCVPPARAIAPLSLQTSLTPALCGPILVVQARPG